MRSQCTLFLALHLGLVACGEPIEPAPGPKDAGVRTLPVVASGRTYKVGEAFRASITVRRPGLTSTSRHVDVVTAVADGRVVEMDRHLPDGSVDRLVVGEARRTDFSMFEGLLPSRTGEVPESWTVEGALSALHSSTLVGEMPREGGRAECRIESVHVNNGRSRAVIAVKFDAESPKGPIRLAGRMEHDLQEKLLVLVALDGTVAGEALSIRADRGVTRFVPPVPD